MGPVEKGVTKIQEKFHHKEDDNEEVSETELEVEEHVEEDSTGSTSHFEV